MKPALRTTTFGVLKDLVARGPSTLPQETGFFDNWQTALGQAIDTNMSISKFINYTLPEWERNQKLESYVLEGRIPDSDLSAIQSIDGHKRISYNALAKAAKKRGLPTQTDDELMESVREDLKVRREYSADVFRRGAPYVGKLGQVLGSLHAGAIDPAVIPSYFIGVGAAAKGASTLAKVARAGLTGAVIGGGTQAVIEPFVYKWKHDLKLDHSVGDAIADIAMAAGLGGAIPAGAVSVVPLAKSLRALLSDPAVVAARASDTAVDQAAKAVEVLIREADEGVKRFTPAQESAVVFLRADIESGINRSFAAREGLRNRLIEEELASQQLAMDESLSITEAGAAEYWSAIEGEVKNLDHPSVLNDNKIPDAEALDDAELDELFNSVTSEEAPITIANSDKPATLEVAKAADVVDNLDKQISDLKTFIACLSKGAL